MQGWYGEKKMAMHSNAHKTIHIKITIEWSHKHLKAIPFILERFPNKEEYKKTHKKYFTKIPDREIAKIADLFILKIVDKCHRAEHNNGWRNYSTMIPTEGRDILSWVLHLHHHKIYFLNRI